MKESTDDARFEKNELLFAAFNFQGLHFEEMIIEVTFNSSAPKN